MKLPRKGILIRLAIYLPLIGGLLVWRACYFEREEIIEQPAPVPPTVGEPGSNQRVRTIVGPEGEEMKIIEITEEEARQMGVEIPERPAKPSTPSIDGAKKPE